MDYNSQRERLVLPEYGRMVQQMVDYAITVENRNERQELAEIIVKVMGNFYPQMRNVQEFRHKLWGHLAVMSKHRLDIDYPVEVSREEENVTPEKVPYPSNGIRFRHYGHLLEDLLSQLPEMEDGVERDMLVKMIAERMKVNLIDSKGEGIEDAKIIDDIALYTDGKIIADPEKLELSKVKHRPAEQYADEARGRRKRKK